MRKTRVACFGVLFFLTITVSSARADSFCADQMVVTLNNSEGFQLINIPEQSRAGISTVFEEFFETNNGKHLGFSVAAANRGNKFGLFKDHPGGGKSSGGGNRDTIPNPEPTAVFLLGTGLVAAGAYARKHLRKSGR